LNPEAIRKQLEVVSLFANPQIDREHDEGTCGDRGEEHGRHQIRDEIDSDHRYMTLRNGEQCRNKNSWDHQPDKADDQADEQYASEASPPEVVCQLRCASYRLQSSVVLEHHSRDWQLGHDREPNETDERRYARKNAEQGP
jgi:hypothetical protein